LALLLLLVTYKVREQHKWGQGEGALLEMEDIGESNMRSIIKQLKKV
jgi:hypothetical protein